MFQLFLEEPREEDAECQNRFSSNFAHYYLHEKEMFYDFTIRTKDGGAVPANKAKTELYVLQFSGLGTPFFSVWYVTFFSVLKKECSVLSRSFLEFLVTYETQINVPFFSVLF